MRSLLSWLPNLGSLSGVDYFIVIVRDLSAKIQTEQALAEKEALLNTAVHASSTGFAITDPDGRFIEVNEALCHWLGFSRDEMIGLPAIKLTPTRDLEIARETFTEMLAGELDVLHQEKRD